jgi:hypothetical protein
MRFFLSKPDFPWRGLQARLHTLQTRARRSPRRRLRSSDVRRPRSSEATSERDARSLPQPVQARPGGQRSIRWLSSGWVDHAIHLAYHFVMQHRLRWVLVFMRSTLDHLDERGIDAEDVADAVFARFGPARVRHQGRGRNRRWLVVGPLEGGQLLSCVFRAAREGDLEASGVFQLPPASAREEALRLSPAMRVCVSGRLSSADETRSYRAWQRSKGGR